ncbi:MAG TPA: TIGR02466 family protein [Rhizomicrobium sp.]|nr:TIGR02466 family protein [Rhizomicrobium sp.]
MQVVPIFINFIATETLRIDNARVEKYCYALKASSSGRVVSNGGGWQSNDLPLDTPELQELFQAVTDKLNELHRYFGFNDTLRQSIDEAWININKKGNFNYTHNHPGKFFSCVYYVKGGQNKGNIDFTTPIEGHAYTIHNNMVTAHNSFSGHALSVPPITGELLIFPSWLNHVVRQSESDEDRISIAVNSHIG